MSIHSTLLSAMSSQITFLKEKNKELNQAEIQENEQSLDLITDLFFDLGGALALLRTETKQLTSSTTTLKLQLNQLKLNHIAETESLLKNQQQQLNLVSKKIESIIEEIQFIKKDNQYVVSESAILSLINLQQEISQNSSSLSKKYLEEVDYDEVNDIAKEQPLQVQQSESPLYILKEPALNQKFRKLNEEMQVWKEEIYPLRKAHEQLIKNQKNIVLLHQKDLEETQQICSDSLKKIFDLVTATEKNNSLKTLITFNTSVIKYNILSSRQGDYFTSAGKARASKINEEFQIKINTAFSMIIDPKNLKKEF